MDDENVRDVFSVVNGFRDVGFICLNGLKIKSIKGDDVLFERVPRQKSMVKKYLKEYHHDYTLIKNTNSRYFISKKASVTKVKDFIKKYPDIMCSKKSQTELGLLLGYPECCVKNKNKKSDLDYDIPFNPCSVKCAKNWLKNK